MDMHLSFTQTSSYKWGTGMIASSSTFCPHPGRVSRDLFRHLHAEWHGTEALVYSNHPREAGASLCLAIIFGRIASGIPWLLRSTAVLMQLSHQCWRCCRLQKSITGNSVFDIRSLTWDEWSYPEGVILPIVTLGTIRPKDSGAARNGTEFQHLIAQRNRSFWPSGHVCG